MGLANDTAAATAAELVNGHVPNGKSPKGKTKKSKSMPAVSNVSKPTGKKASSSKYRHTFAVHSTSRTSCLSHDSEEAPSFVGFRNLMILVILASNLRLMIENLKKYGILVSLSGDSVSAKDAIYGTVLYLSVPCHLFVAYLVEVWAARYAKGAVASSKRSEANQNHGKTEQTRREFHHTWRLIAFLHGINATLGLAIATYVVYYEIFNPGIATVCELHAVIVWLKVCSYAFTNRDMRHALLNPDPEQAAMPAIYKSCPYPNNITLNNLCYFWWAPTLVYQPVYPRTDKIRWGFVVKRIAEALCLCIVIWFASAQYAVPLLHNSLNDISKLSLVNIFERMLKLSTISLVCWLAGFFALFQSFLNALAEVMRFGDREFYGDWWNSYNLRAYWTSWNKPVTNFMKRHVYAPLIGRGVPPTLAQIITFLFSGFLHEILVGVPTHNILGVAFAGMVLQLPLIHLTDPLIKVKSIDGKTVGNIVFWLSFCLFGQPLAALLYYFAWQAAYGVGSRPQYPDLFGLTKGG
ncbi:hypothetical protein K431DRAFT_284588 [Polychaeton citri CBS 116435]|uniref:O-acyltransferase n=1 Tax=Polychaeton citri CBS 116435 TaxID=1314669 RepID=A0A9P4Q8Z1_9PEZI|nr:hypothetical protein K431DRAFT_284588 [Polychaeton citri CBS 116435]